MIILRQVYYSQKHDENWYKGEETDFQKKNRKGFVGGLVGFSGCAGIAGGIGTDTSHIKAIHKETLARMADADKEFQVDVTKLRTAPYVKPQDRETYNRLLKEVDKRLEHNKAATERFIKRAKKITNKKLAKSAGKGAVIGLGIGGGLGYLVNKGIKSSNEKGNAARRNKYKNLKDNDNTKTGLL